jgi:acyl-CoA synthetase (AMP-forming)/AMP-acid ligase II
VQHEPFASITDALDQWSAQRSDRTAFIFLEDGEREVDRCTFAELRRRSLGVARLLRQHVAPGERVLLAFPPGLEFVASFLGCLYAGVIAVPVNVPRRNRYADKFSAVAQDCGARGVLSTGALQQGLLWLLSDPALANLRWWTVDEALRAANDAPVDTSPNSPLAFLQYTSGSTGDPKGVMVTHENLIANERAIRCSFGHDESTVVAGWLPLFHDMGLIGNVLQPLYLGVTSVLMSPMDFLQRPITWLTAISRYRATTSGAPNFAYDLCFSRVRPERVGELDLSSWTVAYCGAEPVRADTLQRFAEKFAPAGFRYSAFYPCYGMAECTLFVTGGNKGEPETVGVDPQKLEHHRLEVSESSSARQLVSCGWTWSDHEVAIVDPLTKRRCGPGHVGEIWVRGPSVAQGYWQRDQATSETFGAQLEGEDDRYLRTGDLGLLHDGRLFVTGRIKDLIIIRGRNHYPQDLERTAERSHPALAEGGGAAFSVERAGQEVLVLAVEVDMSERHSLDTESIAKEVRTAVTEAHELSVADVVLLQPRTLPRTSSGKVRRSACREAYLRNELPVFAARSARSIESEPSLP